MLRNTLCHAHNLQLVNHFRLTHSRTFQIGAMDDPLTCRAPCMQRSRGCPRNLCCNHPDRIWVFRRPYRIVQPLPADDLQILRSGIELDGLLNRPSYNFGVSSRIPLLAPQYFLSQPLSPLSLIFKHRRQSDHLVRVHIDVRVSFM